MNAHLRIEPAARAAILAAARAARRQEPCGYLLGTSDDRGSRIRRIVRARNAHPQPERAFGLDPEEGLAVRRRAAAEGLRVLGIWHAHLVGAPRPGPSDHRGAGPLALPWMVIAGRVGDRWTLGAWRTR